MATPTANGGYATTEGTLHVSKPFRDNKSKKMRAVVTFHPRKSHFDTSNEASGTNEFRGFFTLFWISMFLFTVQTYITSFETHGYALSMGFATMFSRDAVTLALSDLLLVATTGLCVPFAKAVSKGWIRYYWVGVIIQHVFQTLVLVVAVTWTFNRQWPWVQSGFLTLHSLVMIMKMHSYMTVNGYLQWVRTRAKDTFGRMSEATEEYGGIDQAISVARQKRYEEEAPSVLTTGQNTTEIGTPVIQTPSEMNRSSTELTNDTNISTRNNDENGPLRHYTDPSTAAALRKRLNAISAGERSENRDEGKRDQDMKENANIVNEAVKNGDVKRSGDATPSPSVTSTSIPDRDPAYALKYHPDAHIAALAKEYVDLDSELVSAGPAQVRWPENISLKNFVVYQLIPTLVYELEYPRTDRIRPIYVFEKTTAFMGSFALLYTVTESFIIPLTPTPDQSFFRSLLDLALPFMIAYLLLFYIIFECICNGFAELSYFADRQFYEDWWNSTSWDEFSRKWNKPVHTFLLRHVYASTLSTYPISRFTAMFLTFLLSAAAHELVMTVVTKKIRMYLFVMQLAQIPMILVSRAPFIKRNKLMGNVVFWLGLYAGFPLLCVAYVAY
ncbi:hypothetical protein CONPUDRAFT_59491 [Coniophora puteana RWD-64-598 SS2]|uniref:O-acyltransferase n=1 Tax=Coniophora puteana (strain RWD-64-598) TaxID=741705 RepID=A0A5M3MK28_CONPW|nr:uncharacterized protein CONPUDRAFT_59491 [Coniophora puteana RWD-64-598 SS2]EIW79413.1 hypothetical protein CONPUDRAFT_59491 [Coniophora puteana RWD-64-598 SS2]